MSAAPTRTDAQPSRPGRLLALVRKLIDYGKELAATLQQRTDAAALARIMCGLHCAYALQDRIVQSAARLDADRKPCASRAATPPQPARASHDYPTQQPGCCQPRATPHGGADRRQGAPPADRCCDCRYLPRPRHPAKPPAVAGPSTGHQRFPRQLRRLVIDILKRPLLILGQDGPAAAQAVLLASACATGPP